MPEKEKKEKKKAFETARKTFKYFLPEAWRLHKGFFLLFAFRTILAAVQPFVQIMTMPLIIDELLGGRDVKKLLFYAAVLVAGGALLSLIVSFSDVTLEKYDEKFQNYFTEAMSRRVMELDFQLTEDKQALDQIELARTGMSWYSGGVYGITSQFFYLIASLLKIAGVVLIIALNAPILFFIAAALLIGNALAQGKINKISIRSFNNLSKSNRIFGYLGWELQDFRYGKDIRLYEAQDMMTEKWDHFTDECVGIWKKEADETLPFSIIMAILNALNSVGMHFYLGVLVIIGKITLGTFSQMFAAGSTFNDSLQNTIWKIQEIVKRTNYAYEYVKFMEYPAAIEKGTRHIEDKPHTIEFRNVSFTYPNTDVRVLNGVNVTLEQGEHLSVVGLNGAGKTTFVKLLCRLYDPTEGEILLDGVNIKEYDYGEYMSLFSPVFQDFKLFSLSMKDNIVMDSDYSDDEVARLIGQVGLEDKVSSLENGVETMLFKAFDENGIEPSGGEQQKIAIARALFKKSPVVILDEPTAALDPVAEYDIYRQFNDLVGGKTAIYISHRLSSCKFCDRIAVFSEGRIAEYGTHDSLADAEGGIYAEMFAAQAQYYQ